jgi:thiamine transporter ThiT
MNNTTKTTIAGIVAAGAFILKIFKVDLPTEVTDGLVAIAVFCVGFFAQGKEGK